MMCGNRDGNCSFLCLNLDLFSDFCFPECQGKSDKCASKMCIKSEETRISSPNIL